MNFKTRLTLLFVGLFFIVLTAILSFIYIFYAEFRREEFFERLRDKSISTARLLVEVQRVDIDLLKIVDQNSINKMYDEKILIFDRNNTLIYSSLDDEKINYSQNLLNQIRTKEDKYYVDDDGDEVVGVHYTEQGHDYVVLASAYDTYGISKMQNLKDLVALSLLLGTVLIAVASHFYIRQVFRPIDELNNSIQNITENNLHEFISVKKDKDELDRLASNYNQMLERLMKAFESQRAFVRNAAHELKTPLALIRSKLEALDEQAGSIPAPAQQLIRNISDDIDGQAALVESLLLIQRLQSQLPIHKSRFRVDELLYESVKELGTHYPQQKVSIDIDASVDDESKLIAHANPLLLKICFRNLIENAALYSRNRELSIIILHHAPTLQLRFINAGDEALPVNVIFEPFFRHTGQQEKPGHGLGLSIIRQIMDQMKGEVTYSFQDNNHVFSLIFPN